MKQIVIRKQDKFKDGRSRFVIDDPNNKKIYRLGKPEKLLAHLIKTGYIKSTIEKQGESERKKA